TITGAAAINGTGTISLSNTTANRILGATVSGVEILTQGASHTIQGAGQVGAGFMGLINNGVIDANLSNALTIDPSNVDTDGAGADVLNNGTLRGSGSAGLSLAGGDFKNLGTIEALDGSAVAY